MTPKGKDEDNKGQCENDCLNNGTPADRVRYFYQSGAIPLGELQITFDCPNKISDSAVPLFWKKDDNSTRSLCPRRLTFRFSLRYGACYHPVRFASPSLVGQFALFHLS